MKVFKDSYKAIQYITELHDNWTHVDDYTELIIWHTNIYDVGMFWKVNEIHKNWGEDITLGMFPDINEALRYCSAYEMYDYKCSGDIDYYGS